MVLNTTYPDQMTEPLGARDDIQQLPVSSLAPDPFQPRLEFKDAALQELANSISLHGILTPLLVRPMQGPGSRGRYWIVAGERRYRAAQQLGLKSLPCRIRDYENTTAAVVALAENVHRQDLSELEKAEALLRIKTLTERTWEQLAELVKLSPDYVKRLVGLLKLADPVKVLLREGRISARVAIALKPLPPRHQIRMAERAVQEGLSAEQIREEAQQFRTRTTSAPPTAPNLHAVHNVASRSGVGREGTVVRILRDCKTAVGEIDHWVGERRWPRAGISPQQRDELAALHEKVSLLHQQLAQITQSLRENEEDPAEKLRNATLLFAVLIMFCYNALLIPL